MRGLFFMSCMVSHCSSGIEGSLISCLTGGGATCTTFSAAFCSLSVISTSRSGSSCRVLQKSHGISWLPGSILVDNTALLVGFFVGCLLGALLWSLKPFLFVVRFDVL